MTKKDAILMMALVVPLTVYAGLVIIFDADPLVSRRWEFVFWSGVAIALFLELKYIRKEGI